MIHKTTIVLVEHKIGNVDHPVETLEMEGKEIRQRERSPYRDNQVRRHRDSSTSQKLGELAARLDAINTGAGTLVTVDALIKQTEPPFTRRGMKTRVSFKFKLPTQLEIYEGKTNPTYHLDSYKA